MVGYLLIISYCIVLASVTLFQKKRIGHGSYAQFLYYEKSAGTYLLTCNIFNSWFWATSVLGAAEASYIFGISGGFAYVFGASAGYVLTILVIVKTNRLMGESSFVTGYLKKRFSTATQQMFFGFAILVAIYIMVEQAVGIGVVFSSVYGTSFKKIAFLSLVLAITFVVKSGMRGVLINDVVNFVIIAGLFGGIFGIISLQSPGGWFASPNYFVQLNGKEASFMNILSIGAFRYFIIAIIVGFAQSVMDQGYWLKAKAAKNEKTFIHAQILGGFVLWIPITLCCSLVFGFLVYTGTGNPENISVFGEVLTKSVFMERYGYYLAVAFSIAILCVVMTTMTNCLMGIFSLAASEIYPTQISEDGTEDDALRFGKIFTVLTGGFCGLIALSLENISLLSIDTFSGIFFAAPCATLCGGLIFHKKFGNQGIMGTAFGIIIGLAIWLYLKNPNLDGFIGTLASFGIPLLYFGLLNFFIPNKFNNHSLKL
jgi:Na+/proline symporter